MVKVVSFKICPFVQRVIASLEIRDVGYEVEYISLSNKPKWFLDIAPNGQVPVLITESGIALFESEAIIEYIDAEMGPIEENLSNEEKALDYAWSYQASKNYLVQCSAQRSGNKEILEKRSVKLGKVFAVVENKLGSGPYFKGNKFSKVDIAWLPLMHRAAIIEQQVGYDFLVNYPEVKKWQQELLRTGIAERSVAKDFREEFVNFYLSKETYLGSSKENAEFDMQCARENCC